VHIYVIKINKRKIFLLVLQGAFYRSVSMNTMIFCPVYEVAIFINWTEAGLAGVEIPVTSGGGCNRLPESLLLEVFTYKGQLCK